MIEFSHVYKTYPGPVQALRDVHLEIRKGEFVFLTGPSGAGKTTLFRMLCGYDKPTSGLLKVLGADLSHLSAQEMPFFRRKIGVVYQDFRLLNNRTVFENVALPLEVRGEKTHQINSRVEEVLASVSLSFKKNQYPLQLSGGEQQRVSIARALVHHPGILIADEPTGNLDPDLSEEIMNLLDKVNAQGTTVFVATHDHDIVSRRAKRVIEIQNGRITRWQ